MILFRRVVIDRSVYKKVLHHSITTKKRMFAVSWALNKGDWWKDKQDEKAKFFSADWRKKSNEYIRTALYIGRLAVVWQFKPQAIDRSNPLRRKPEAEPRSNK